MAMWIAELLAALVGGVVDWVSEDVGQANVEEENETGSKVRDSEGR